MTELPIQAVLPDLLAALRTNASTVLIAPPGAGKTTAVAPALLAEPWCTGQVLVLSPRRLAARAAAERMAELAGEQVGQTIGYATRMDSRASPRTRVLVMTEGIFIARIQADPELAGISAVLFDEIHERSLDSDFGLALALDVQAGLRPDLCLVAMSATLDGTRFATLMDGAPVIESAGRMHDLAIHHLGRDPSCRIEDEMVVAIRRALIEQAGGVLAFLPGVAEIERVADRVAALLPPDCDLFRLHGSLDPAEQRAAIRPSQRRKLVLATAIAETSLTLDGIAAVVDSGLARRPRYDRVAGVARLVTERVSQAAATQRAGRAARQGPGIAYRLWEEAATAGLPRFDPPEILEADLSPLLLACAIWGSDPLALRWLDPPPVAALDEARGRLLGIGAIDADGRPTPHGRAIATLPVPPRLAHMLLRACEQELGLLAAEVAVLLSERGLGGSDVDLAVRLSRWRRETGPRAEAARRLARSLATRAAEARPEARGLAPAGVQRPAGSRPDHDVTYKQLADPYKGNAGQGQAATDDDAVARCIALAFPDRIARRRDVGGERWQSTGGRGFRLDPSDPLARHEWLAVADVQGSAGGARITAAAALEIVDSVNYFRGASFGVALTVTDDVRFDTETRAVTARRQVNLGAITLSSAPASDVDPAVLTATLLDAIGSHGLDLLPWSEHATRLRQRAAFAAAHGGPSIDLSDETLLAARDDWLAPVLAGVSRLDAIDPAALDAALSALIPWEAQRALERFAPDHYASPAGSRHPIDYGAPGGPQVTLRVQAVFGINAHPVIADGRVPLVLALTSPAGRPIQTTRDLPAFWRGSWRDVAKEMRGRYPRHHWPDDPAGATASLRTKRADASAKA